MSKSMLRPRPLAEWEIRVALVAEGMAAAHCQRYGVDDSATQKRIAELEQMLATAGGPLRAQT